MSQQQEIPEVDSLPVVAVAAYPTFPDIPQQRILVIAGSKWGKMEKEQAVMALVNACMMKGQWQPVKGDDVIAQLRRNPLVADFNVGNVAQALWQLVHADEIHVVRYRDENYFIPTPQLAHGALDDPQKLRTM